MAVSDLNVRLGLIYKDFDKSLKNVESSLNRTADRLSGLGNGLSVGLTLPLLAFAKSAVTASADMENMRLAMETTMKAGGRSISDAHRELELLRQAALAPGLDMEQAIQGSIRLQNVGFSAEKSRGILVQLANAIAMTGGSAPQLDSVTKQFGQMIAKGRIMQEDLGIIQENMPTISQAMEKAFGTKSAEKLRNMGISAEMFIDGVTKQLALLPRVSGGLQNAMVNAGSAIKQFFGGVGDEIAKVLDLKNGSDQLSAALGNAATWFKTLTDEQKKSIVQWALYAAALGPAIKGISLIYSGGAAAVSALRAISSGLASTGSAALGLADKFTKMSTAMKFTVAGAVIAGVVALAAAFVYLSDTVANANVVYKTLQEIEKEAVKSTMDERAAIAPLISTLQSETSSRAAKEDAIKRLQAISPKYFAGLDIESAKTGALKSSVDAYVQSLLMAARVKAAGDKLIALDVKEQELMAQKAETMTRIEKLRKFQQTQTIEGATKIEENIQQQLKLFQAQEAEYKRQKDAIQGVIDKNTTLTDSQIQQQAASEAAKIKQVQANAKLQASSEGAAKSAKAEGKEMAKAYSDTLDKIKGAEEGAKIFGDTFNEQADDIEAGIKRMLDAGWDVASEEMGVILNKAKKLKASLGLVPVQLDAKAANADLKEFESQAIEATAALESGLKSGFGEGDKGAQDLIQRAKDLREEIAFIRPDLKADEAVATLNDLRVRVGQLATDVKDKLGSVGGGINIPFNIESESAELTIKSLAAQADELRAKFAGGFSSSMDAESANAALGLLRQKVADFADAIKAGIEGGFIESGQAAQALESRAESLRAAFASVPVGLSVEDATNALNRLSGDAVELSMDLKSALANGFTGGQPALDALIGKAMQLQGVVDASFEKVLSATKATGQLASIPSNVTPKQVTSQTQTPLAVKIPEVVPETFERATGQAYLLEQGIEGISVSMASFVLGMGGGVDAMNALGEGMRSMAESAGGAFEGLAGSLMGVEGSYKSVGAAALAAAAKMVQAALAATLAKAIQQSVARSGHPLLGIALAGVAVAGVNALFAKVMQGFKKTPKFATGTNNAPGGLALVGELGPEMVNLPKGARVHPANQTSAMIRDMTDGGRFGTKVEGEFKIRGSDLVVVLEKSTKKTNRIRGN